MIHALYLLSLPSDAPHDLMAAGDLFGQMMNFLHGEAGIGVPPGLLGLPDMLREAANSSGGSISSPSIVCLSVEKFSHVC